MSAQPPVFRDFEIYHLIRVEQKSTREVAAEVGVSQTRVRQVVERVANFLLEAVPEGGDAKLASRVELAKILASERLNALYGEAYNCWRNPDRVQQTVREVVVAGKPRQQVTRKSTQNDCKYLHAAAKLAQLAAKMPAYSLFSWMPEEDDTPEEDCSPAADKTPTVQPARGPQVAASLPREFTSALEACREERQTTGAARPAQAGGKSPALSPQDRQKRRAFLANAG